MNWTKASAIAEILSSVAVLITLLYLVIEIGQNTAALEASSRQAALENSLQTFAVGIDSPELWLSRVKADLTETERVRLSAFIFGLLRRGEVAWQQYQAGALDEDGWNDVLTAVIATLHYVQPRKLWDYMEEGYSPEFRDQVNDLLADRPVVTQLEYLQVYD